MVVGQFANRVVVVTGGNSGIGRATAIAFAEAGASVFVGDVASSDEALRLFAELKITYRRCDVRVEDELRQLIDVAAQSTGRIDVLVNNAGVTMVRQVADVTEDEWDLCLDTNLKAAFFGSKHVVGKMQPDGGVIVNIASNAGLLPRAHDPVYSTSKHAVVGLTKSLALALSRDKIRVNAVCPGPVCETGLMNTDLEAADDPATFAQQVIDASPIAAAHGRMITPEEIAQSVLYLASDAALMVTGTCIAIDGGKSLGVPPSR